MMGNMAEVICPKCKQVRLVSRKWARSYQFQCVRTVPKCPKCADRYPIDRSEPKQYSDGRWTGANR